MSRGKRFLSAVTEAIGGTQRDFTEGSLSQGVLLLAIPMVLEMSMESVFAVVDIFFVARLGEDAISSVAWNPVIKVFAVIKANETFFQSWFLVRIDQHIRWSWYVCLFFVYLDPFFLGFSNLVAVSPSAQEQKDEKDVGDCFHVMVLLSRVLSG